MKLRDIFYFGRARDSTEGSAYRFFFGPSSAGKNVNVRNSMLATAVYTCVRALSEAYSSI